ncbi:hypothetical protein F5Y12DRAFT_712363 [Xylaria sp. FL1777]|nr:hypothetical protein F5Y12DRAFT_712363 [Xylaria sp. FL1777]
MEPFHTFASYRQDRFLSEAPIMANHINTGVDHRSSRRPSSRTNFSYPRLSRHESNESRSSNGSAPGMTDASDSDLSFDEDGIYNTSAGELWDSFWPDDAESSSIYRQSQESQLALLQPRQGKDYLKLNPIRYTPFDADDETIKIVTRGYDSEEEEPPSPRTTTQPPPLGSTPLLSSPSRPLPKRSPVTYSIYPKPSPPVISVPRHPHPPRTSSLSFEPPSPPRRPSFLGSSRSSTSFKPSKSTHNMHSLFIAPSMQPYNKLCSPQQQSSSTAPANVATTTTTSSSSSSVPVSPVYPPPPTPKTLRPSTSAFSLRDKIRARSDTRGLASHHHRRHDDVTTPLLPSPLPEPLPAPPQQQQQQRPQFVSVFELDSDSESDAEAANEGPSFARRIARGLHKRTTIEKEKRSIAERKASTAVSTTAGLKATLDAGTPEKRCGGERLRDGDSLSRNRGGSLGRIFGFIGI